MSLYEKRFSLKIFKPETKWFPHVICYNMLYRNTVKYSASTKWKKPQSQDDCYVCMTVTAGYNSVNSKYIKCPNVSSVTKACISFGNTVDGFVSENPVNPTWGVEDSNLSKEPCENIDDVEESLVFPLSKIAMDSDEEY